MTTERSNGGAYGFRITGVGTAGRLLGEAPGDWPLLDVRQMLGPIPEVTSVITDDAASVELLPSGIAELDRAAGTAVYLLEVPLSVEALVHPYLAPAAAIHAAWRGWEPYHAAGVVIDGAVWGIAGDRGVGKSTLVAAFHAAGHTVMTDDLLVIRDTEAMRGPRTVDLRSPDAERFGATRDLGVAGMRRRWRIDLGEAPPTAPFAGWIYPAWADGIEISDLSLAARLERTPQHRAVSFRPVEPDHAMWMAGRRALHFGRPRSWDALEASLERLVAALS